MLMAVYVYVFTLRLMSCAIAMQCGTLIRAALKTPKYKSPPPSKLPNRFKHPQSRSAHAAAS